MGPYQQRQDSQAPKRKGPQCRDYGGKTGPQAGERDTTVLGCLEAWGCLLYTSPSPRD